MKKVVRLYESELVSLIKKVIAEDEVGCVNISKRASEIQSEVTEKVLQKFKQRYLKGLTGQDDLGIKKELLKYVSSNSSEIDSKMRYYINDAIKSRVGAGSPVNFNDALYDVSNVVISQLFKVYNDSLLLKGVLSYKITSSNVQKEIEKMDYGFKNVLSEFYLALSTTFGVDVASGVLDWQIQNYPKGTKICDFGTTTNRPEVSDFINNLEWLKGKISEILRSHA